MRSDLQDPFQKEFLKVKLSLLKKIQHFRLQLSAGELGTWRARTMRARGLVSSHHASSWPASWLARDLRAGELAPSELVGWQPCQLAGCWSSRPASWVP
ncbi:UNVERIFIED_CONTAM: hypothetical protein Slati_2236600 [Sesamum latifolium]|uniref:Uncharacterized protein n=1 Tax=Sesamum latifolium TaxID=2727402 RepID=A0AAW2WW41_9LAMI